MLTQRQASIDVATVAGCSLFYVAASLMNVPILWMVGTVSLVLIIYSLFVLWPRKQPWRDYGVGLGNFWQAATPVGIWTAITILLVLIVGISRGNEWRHPQLLFMLLLYPAWGIIQQFIFQGLLHRGLIRLCRTDAVALTASSLLFASVHIADLRVVGLTLVAGFFWSWFFQRWQNVLVLGISHGWVAALVYPLLLGENPWENFL